MKIIKSSLVVAVLAVVCLSLAACGGKSDDEWIRWEHQAHVTREAESITWSLTYDVWYNADQTEFKFELAMIRTSSSSAPDTTSEHYSRMLAEYPGETVSMRREIRYDVANIGENKYSIKTIASYRLYFHNHFIEVVHQEEINSREVVIIFDEPILVDGIFI